MIQLIIRKTGKSYSPHATWQTFDDEIKTFSTIKEAHDWLLEEYKKCKRVQMYVDDKEGKTHHIGYIYSFKNSDISHVPVEKWIQQDWIEFRNVKTIHFN